MRFKKNAIHLKRVKNGLAGAGLGLLSGATFAGNNIGDVAGSITSTFSNITLLVTGGAYVAGLAFAVGAIMKFKMHKDNPQSTPIGTPVALVFIAAALIFLPSALSVTGSTMFGSASVGSGSAGTEIGNS